MCHWVGLLLGMLEPAEMGVDRDSVDVVASTIVQYRLHSQTVV